MKLKRIADLHSGYQFRKRIIEDPDGNVGVIQLKNITEYLTIDRSRILKKKIIIKGKDVLKPGDILFAAKSLSHNALIYDGNNILKEIAAPQFIIISVNRPEVMPEFIVWFLNSGLGQSYLNKMSEGSSLQIISIKLLGELEIPIIPIDEQRKVIRLNQLKLKEEKLLHRLQVTRRLLIDQALEKYIQNQQMEGSENDNK